MYIVSFLNPWLFNGIGAETSHAGQASQERQHCLPPGSGSCFASLELAWRV